MGRVACIRMVAWGMLGGRGTPLGLVVVDLVALYMGMILRNFEAFASSAFAFVLSVVDRHGS